MAMKTAISATAPQIPVLEGTGYTGLWAGSTMDAVLAVGIPQQQQEQTAAARPKVRYSMLCLSCPACQAQKK
ncbi:hypothetical protein LTR62_002535 [Meristemomyces frigidus]|uniref:Uncharacterized protein n=1 Tax=Meristemomyces frigidus TaxID=1508187 RepID=A0AAN7TSN9_9PEZI|nr:hypothetical protein LTR62_002535 [Meristemomyces frigidus]